MNKDNTRVGNTPSSQASRRGRMTGTSSDDERADPAPRTARPRARHSRRQAPSAATMAAGLLVPLLGLPGALLLALWRAWLAYELARPSRSSLI